MLRRRTNLALATCACSGPSGAARPFKTGMPNATRDLSGPIIDRGVRLPPHATIPARIDATPPCIVLPSDRKFGASVPWTTAPSANRATCWMTGIAQLTALWPSAGITYVISGGRADRIAAAAAERQIGFLPVLLSGRRIMPRSRSICSHLAWRISRSRAPVSSINRIAASAWPSILRRRFSGFGACFAFGPARQQSRVGRSFPRPSAPH